MAVHLGEVAEWSKAAVLKTADPQGSVGSNPTLSASCAPPGSQRPSLMYGRGRVMLAFSGEVAERLKALPC